MQKQAWMYPLILRQLHWVIAFLVIAALCMSTFVMHDMADDDPAKLASAGRHMLAGVAIGLAILIRLFTHRRYLRPQTPSSGFVLVDLIGKGVHRLLDSLVIVMLVSGILLAFRHQLPELVIMGGVGLPPALASDWVLVAHRYIAGMLAGFIALHAVGALFHQLILCDRLLTRITWEGGPWDWQVKSKFVRGPVSMMRRTAKKIGFKLMEENSRT